MASFNRIIMMGNLTRDPEHKQLGSGQAVCRLGLASNRQFKNKQTGSMVQEVCFVDIDVWGPQAESCRQYLSKGRAVLIEGRLKMDTWQDASGSNRTKHLIVADRVTFLAGGPQADDSVDSANAPSSEPEGVSFAPAVAPKNETSQEIKPARKRAVTSGTKQDGTPASLTSGEVTLKDEAPFEDDLPF